MTKELDEKLCKTYPKIFANRNGDMRNTAMCWGFNCGDGWYQIIDSLCSNLQWNTDKNNIDYVIENKTLRKLISFLNNIAQRIPGSNNFGTKKKESIGAKIRWYLIKKINNWRSKQKFIKIESNRYPQVVASQVKEKFGGLRFYVEKASDQQYAVISFVESLSYKVCEKCGSMKDIGRTQGWITTLCKNCANPDSNWKLLTDKEDE